jgi:hypothetical protein
MPSISSQFEVSSRATDISPVALQALENAPVDASVILPTLYKCIELDKVGQSPPGHLWIVIYSRTGSVALVLSCTDGYMEAYPIFIVNTSPIEDNDLATHIDLLTLILQRHVPVERVYSVFGPIRITQVFSNMWTQLTGIQAEPSPYYDAKVSCLRRHKGLGQSITSGRSTFEVGLATQADILPIAKLCHAFASDSVSAPSISR